MAIGRLCVNKRHLSRRARLTVFAKKRDTVAVYGPNSILDRWCSDFGQYLLLLNVKENNGCRRGKQKTSGSTIKDVVGLDGTLDGLG